MKGLGKRILVMAAVTAVCVWAAGKSGYAVKPYRLDEDTLAQQVQTLKENNLTMFSGVTIYDGIVIGDTAYYVMKQDVRTAGRPARRNDCETQLAWYMEI